MKLAVKYQIISIFVVAQFLLDLITKIYGNQYLYLDYGIKCIKLLFLILFIGILWRERKLNDVKMYLYLISSFFIGQFTLLYFKLVDFESILLAIRELILLLFPLVFWNFLMSLSVEAKAFKQLKRLFEILVLIVVFTTILGVIFSIPFFRTYGGGLRFGYMGLLNKSITASYFYMTALTYFYNGISNGIKEKIGFVCTLVASIFVGTKAIYLFVFLLGVYHLYKSKYYKKYIFYWAILSFVILFSFFYSLLISKLKIVFDVLYDVYRQDGLVAALTSVRDQRMVDNYLFYSEKWSVFNYLFGGRIVGTPLFEMSLLDVFVFFGFFGGIYYLYSIYKVVFSVKKLDNKCFFRISLGTVFFVSIFAGQFFINISAITIVLLGFFFVLNTKEEYS